MKKDITQVKIANSIFDFIEKDVSLKIHIFINIDTFEKVDRDIVRPINFAVNEKLSRQLISFR